MYKIHGQFQTHIQTHIESKYMTIVVDNIETCTIERRDYATECVIDTDCYNTSCMIARLQRNREMQDILRDMTEQEVLNILNDCYQVIAEIRKELDEYDEVPEGYCPNRTTTAEISQ